MCRKKDYQVKALLLLLLLAVGVPKNHGQEEHKEETNGVRQKTAELDRRISTPSSTVDPEGELHPTLSTVSPVNVQNRWSVLKGQLVHEQLLTRDFRGDQHFFRDDGSLAADPTMPGSVQEEEGEAATQLVPHEDAPAFSDIATTATSAATTTPLTTVAPTTPLLPAFTLRKKVSEEKGTGVATTESLTTYVTKTKNGDNHPSTTATTPSTLRGGLPYGHGGVVPVETPSAPPTTDRTAEGREAKSTAGKNKDGPPLTKLTTTASEAKEHEGNAATATSTITTTTITTMQTSGPCTLNFTDPEGDIEIVQQPAITLDTGMECTYLVTVYLGYGIEIQVLNVSVLEGDHVVTVEDTGGREPSILANESVLMPGLVLRSWSNQISIRFHSKYQPQPGSLLLHYQGKPAMEQTASYCATWR